MAKKEITFTRSQTVALAVAILVLCAIALVFNMKKMTSRETGVPGLIDTKTADSTMDDYQEFE